MKPLIDNLQLDDTYTLASFDVVSLFSNLPHKLILDVLKARWDKIKDRIPLGQCEFLVGIRTFLESTYLQFNGKYYKQIMGAPVGF